jgi:hypothetical protein
MQFEQERQKTAALVQELAAARQELNTSTAAYGQTLDEGRARSTALASELATAQRENEMQAAQLRKASEETEQLKQVEAANRAQLLVLEWQHAVLAREFTAARQELTTSTAAHRQALDDERARRAALWSELAAAQGKIETQAMQLRKAGEETTQLEQAEATNNSRLLEQEREKTATLTLQTISARQELAASTERNRQALDEERARSAALASQLAEAQREIETQAVQLRKASEDTEQLKQDTERAATDLRRSLQQERDRTETMARNVEFAGRATDMRVGTEVATNSDISGATQVIEVTAMAQPAAVEAQEGPDTIRLITRARTLLAQGNIGAARTVLERAAETGSALASFTLAETYDPAVLSTWQTLGTRGDPKKARELYAKAHAGGFQGAQDRLNALNK